MQELVHTGSTSFFSRGNVLFYENDKIGDIFILVEGYVKICKYSISGKATIVDINRPGDIILEECLLSPEKPYPATVIALSHVVVRRVYKSSLINESFMSDLLARTVKRLFNAHIIIQEIAAEYVEKRIISTLLRLVKYEGCPGETECKEKGINSFKLNVPLARQDIADMVGTTVETTIRIFKQLIDNGAIRKEGNCVINVLDLEYLRNYKK